ncbi:hypothetical protein [Stappia sp.]|uniref:hypothetical protein n=1 Tax=Stappia sp. TaxID=1870903 RepID=UPI003C7AE5FA
MPPRVSDHAVLRYIERIYGLDVDAVRRHIADEVASAAAAGAITARIRGASYVIRDGVVVTIINGRQMARGRNKKHRRKLGGA